MTLSTILITELTQRLYVITISKDYKYYFHIIVDSKTTYKIHFHTLVDSKTISTIFHDRVDPIIA